MEIKAINFIKNVSYTITSNGLSMLVSALAVLIVPRLLGVEEYGYWQLYLFYSSYVGFFHLGWNDGIYLRYGGQEYDKLDRGLFFSQFWMLAMFQSAIAAILVFGSSIFPMEPSRGLIAKLLAVSMVLANTRTMLLFVLQSTSRIREYALSTILDRVSYFFMTVILLLCGSRDFSWLIVADLSGKVISLLYAMACCRDMVFRRLSSFYFTLREAVANISAGSKLMLANVASMLIIGFVRMGIENAWDVATFGKVSLTLSVSNLLMAFINAIGVVMFPLLRRTDDEKLPAIYWVMRTTLVVLFFGLLLTYYPLRVTLSSWLPNYDDSLRYMAILFPICVYESKVALLTGTYLKALRKEKIMLNINLLVVLISALVSIVTTAVLRNLDLAVISIVVLLVIKAEIAEFYLSKALGVSLHMSMCLELVLVCVFILTGWFIDSWGATALYGIAYTGYLLAKRKDIRDAKWFLRSMIVG